MSDKIRIYRQRLVEYDVVEYLDLTKEEYDTMVESLTYNPMEDREWTFINDMEYELQNYETEWQSLDENMGDDKITDMWFEGERG